LLPLPHCTHQHRHHPHRTIVVIDLTASVVILTAPLSLSLPHHRRRHHCLTIIIIVITSPHQQQ